MNISGIVVCTEPAKINTVAAKLSKICGIKPYGIFEEAGKIIAVMEVKNTHMEVKKFKAIHNITGVLSASMAYHHFENEEAENQEGQ